MPKRTPTLSESTEEEFPALNGGKIKIRKARNGIVQFSTFLTEITDVEKKRVTFKDRIGLQWEGFSELMEDHGQATICGVLHPLGLYILSDAKKAQLLSDIKAKVPSFAYEKLEKYIASQEER